MASRTHDGLPDAAPNMNLDQPAVEKKHSVPIRRSEEGRDLVNDGPVTIVIDV